MLNVRICISDVLYEEELSDFKKLEYKNNYILYVKIEIVHISHKIMTYFMFHFYFMVCHAFV